jgi:catechol 2,3-dioxygenase-like lactoylglutathione lyase family enzyme
VRTLAFSVEVITLPVSDVDRALRFYAHQVGFTLDVDYSPNDAFRVVQLTPPGSSCSIQIGNGLTDAPVGSFATSILSSRTSMPRGTACSNVGFRSVRSGTRRQPH